MKKFLTILVALTVVYSSVNANEIDKPKTEVGMAVVQSGSLIKLFYKGAKASDVKVTILNEKGEAVYKETIRRIESFVRPYNFSSLNEGNYTIQLDGEEGKQLQNISYHKEVTKNLMNLTRLAGSNDKYILSVPNKREEVLNIKIFNAENTLIYSETEKIQSDFAKVYNLGNVGADFTFEITGKDGETAYISYDKN